MGKEERENIRAFLLHMHKGIETTPGVLQQPMKRKPMTDPECPLRENPPDEHWCSKGKHFCPEWWHVKCDHRPYIDAITAYHEAKC